MGREKEFQGLQSSLNELRQGKGCAVAILGEAGLGKSRLVAEIRQSLAVGTGWVETRAHSYGERLSYGVARNLIEGLAGIDEDAPASESARLLWMQVEALFPERPEEVFPYLAQLCELPLDEKMAERVKYLPPEALHGQLVRSFQEYVRARALAEHLVLVWEDLHWIDPSSLRLLETLLPLTAEVPLLVLLVSRSFDEGPVRLDFSLAELKHRELIRQREAERQLPDPEYIFKHAITHEVTYNTLSLARRRVLHRMSAEAIQALFPDRVEELAATLAYHYEKAEEGERAIHYLTKAADRARASYANEEAIKFYGAAIKQADRLKTQQTPRRAEFAPRLRESLGDTLLNAARYEDARAAYREALTFIGEHDRVHQSRLLRKQANSWFNQRRFDESLVSFDAAETALGSRPDNDDAEWWKEWMAIGLDRLGLYYHLNRLTELATLVQKLQPTVDRYGTPSQRRDLIDSLNLIEVRQSRYYMIPDRTLARGRGLLADSRATGDLGDEVHYQFMLGFIHLWRDELDAAKQELEIGLKLALRIGDVANQTKCLIYLALSHRKSNDPEETERYASRALSVARAAQNLAYTGGALSHVSWVAWRQGNLAQAEHHAREALELMPQNYQWRLYALWPLVGISLMRQQIEQTVDCARGILDPELCQMPPDLSAALEEALEAFERSELETMHRRFQQASELAQRRGYL